MGDQMGLPSLFFDKHPNPMFVYDFDTLDMLEVNQSASQKYGFSRDEFLQLTIEDIRPPEDIPKLRERLNQIKRTSDVSDGGTFRHQTKGGDVLFVQITAQFYSVHGRDARIVHVHDLTEPLRLKNEIEANLYESLEEKEILLSEVHHRVKNNLAIVSSLLQLEAMNYDDDSTVWNALVQNKFRVHSMAHIHEHLYDSQDFANISIGEYISDLVDYLCESLQRKNLPVDWSVSCEEIMLNINQAVPCGLMINELVTHAIKRASGPQPLHVNVTVTREDGVVTLTVEDDGAGYIADLRRWSEESLPHQIVEQLVGQLEGDIDVSYTEENKTRYEIKFSKADKSGSTGRHFVK